MGLRLPGAPRAPRGTKRGPNFEKTEKYFRHIQENEPVSRTELATVFGVHPGSAQHHIDNLLHMGRVERVMFGNGVSYQTVKAEGGNRAGIAFRPERVAVKQKLIAELSEITHPRIAKVLKEIYMDYEALKRSIK